MLIYLGRVSISIQLHIQVLKVRNATALSVSPIPSTLEAKKNLGNLTPKMDNLDTFLKITVLKLILGIL